MKNINGLILKGETEEEQLEFLKMLAERAKKLNETTNRVVVRIKSQKHHDKQEYH